MNVASGKATLETTFNQPAMLRVEATTAAGETPIIVAAVELGAAVAPWKLAPSVPRPADFETF